MRVTVIGAGYVGVVTSACFAEVGNDVVCIDTDPKKIECLNHGEMPLREPGLDAIVARNSTAGRLKFSTSYQDAVAHASVIFIAVGTPSSEDGSADLSGVLSCAQALGQQIVRDTLVVIKSTVPVGTNDQVLAALQKELQQRDANVRVRTASNPEFLKEGAAVDDFMRPDRIIVGVNDAAAADVLRALYLPFNRNRDRLFIMDVRSAEFTKYAANAMLALRISFMNEMADMADRLGVDIEEVRHGIGADRRIGPHFLYAGMGFGGSCFPKDLRALVRLADSIGEPALLLRSSLQVNERQRGILFEKIKAFFGGNVQGKTIALWGLAFKANTDDMREAPSIMLVDLLTLFGARVRAYDPAAIDNARQIFKTHQGITFTASAREACEGADVLAVVTEWLEFRTPDFEWLAVTLTHKALFDGRNLYNPTFVRASGLQYFGVGRGQSS
jgi:UDPglucose 6-dehydrogenase